MWLYCHSNQIYLFMWELGLSLQWLKTTFLDGNAYSIIWYKLKIVLEEHVASIFWVDTQAKHACKQSLLHQYTATRLHGVTFLHTVLFSLSVYLTLSVDQTMQHIIMKWLGNDMERLGSDAVVVWFDVLNPQFVWRGWVKQRRNSSLGKQKWYIGKVGKNTILSIAV
jgi:hypothetical protein